MGEAILITRPKYDDGTEYLSAYALEVLKKARTLPIEVKDFEGKEANKENIEKYLKSKNPTLLFLNGHGNETEICGNKDEVIFSLSNIHFLRNKITYARACFSASGLGKQAVKDNNGCFIGYTQPFSFWITGSWSAKPLNDRIASLYLEPSNEIVFSLLKGRTAREADKKSKKMMIENMKTILAMEKKKEPGAMGMFKILWDNYEGQVVLGNEGATF
jgi:hypothetical protein